MVELSVNGVTHVLDVDPQEPAIYALRNQLGLKGPKLGCGLEQCGACAVLVDGQSKLTCRMPIADLEGAAVETVEGLRCAVQDLEVTKSTRWRLHGRVDHFRVPDGPTAASPMA